MPVALSLVEHPLPCAWDGRRVVWDRWERPSRMFICRPPKHPERCSCGSTAPAFTARGLRDPSAERLASAAEIPRIGRVARHVPLAYPVYDLVAFRCPECGEVAVWDMASEEHWVLDDSDYGPDGSMPPGEWSGGLFDLL